MRVCRQQRGLKAGQAIKAAGDERDIKDFYLVLC